MKIDLSKIKVPAHMTIHQYCGDMVSIFVSDGGPIASINLKERCWDFGNREPRFSPTKKYPELKGKGWQQRFFNIVFAELDAARD